MTDSDFVVLAPEGRLDAAGARPLDDELDRHIRAGEVRLLVDLTNTVYISSHGLRTLLMAMRKARRRGGNLKLCCLSPRVREIFEMVGMDKVFEIYSTRDQAAASFERKG